MKLDVGLVSAVLHPDVLDALPLPALVCASPRATIMRWNRRMAAACRRDLRAGDPLTAVVRGLAPDRSPLPESVDTVAAAASAGEPLQGVDAVLASAGGWVPVSVSAEPLVGAHPGQVFGALLLCDTSNRWICMLEREEELTRINRQKDDFLALLGHELKSPLATLATAVRLLQARAGGAPSLRGACEVIERQVAHIGRLVDDLADLGALSAGKLRLDRQRVELNRLVTEAVETCRHEIDRRRHTLQATLSDSPIWVDADPNRIVQVVCNLLNNAAKYMDEGGRIELAVSADRGAAAIRIRDNGVGIAPEMLERIFERFVQVDSTTDRAQGGLGLGLPLVKSIVEMHGGRVDVTSAGAGQGSEFTAVLPAVS